MSGPSTHASASVWGARPRNRFRTTVGDLVFRAKRRVAHKLGDVELRQLRSLQKAYSGSEGPEILVFGDSAMFWTAYTEHDRRHLLQMIHDEFGRGVRCEGLAGPGYNPRIIMPFLSSIPHLSSRPKVVIVPTSIVMCMDVFLEHPKMSYEIEGPAIREAAADLEGNIKQLPRPGEEAFEAFDRMKVPSLIGAKRTSGEVRLIINSAPTTRWQTAVRMRHLMDYYNAERLEEDTPGVVRVREMGAQLKELGLPSVAYVAPVNHDVMKATLGAGSIEHLARNAKVVEDAWKEGAGQFGHIVNAVFDSPSNEFSDPLHLSDVGRHKLAARIADLARPFVTDQAGTTT